MLVATQGTVFGMHFCETFWYTF